MWAGWIKNRTKDLLLNAMRQKRREKILDYLIHHPIMQSLAGCGHAGANQGPACREKHAGNSKDPAAFAACGAAAGLSLGEYCALVFAGALSFEDGLKSDLVRSNLLQASSLYHALLDQIRMILGVEVVKQRATSMAAAARSAADAPHGMLSVVGLHDNDLEEICRYA
eukprot:1157419-Pelagomonas_calceolata.AAC.14